MSRRSVQVGGETLTVEEFSGRKGTWALRLLQYIGRDTPEITRKWADFAREYEQTHAIELDRAQARYQLGERVEQISDADWEKAGNKLRLPRSPSPAEVFAHLFPDVLDVAEKQATRLLALLVTSNQEVKTLGRDHASFEEYLDERGGKLLDDGLFDELLELAVIGGEVVNEQYKRKSSELGDRVGNALSLFGINPSRPTSDSPDTSETTSSPSNATSSTDSPEPTAGASDESLTQPAGASSPVSSTA